MKEPKRSSALVRRETFASYCFLLPSLIFFLGFVIYPMILCVVTSFFDSTMNRADIFVGMANYKTLFADPIFLGALKNTFVIVIVSVPITCIFSLWVSSAIVDLPEWATSLFRCVFYLPVVTGSVAVTVVWKWMYNNYYGIFNYLGKSLCILDKNTGYVEKIVAAHDVGKAVNPLSCEGQIEGGVVMSMGYALTEQYEIDAHCKPISRFGTLGLFRAHQTPEIKAIVLDKPGLDIACGAIGIGEITSIPTAPAIAEAYYRLDGERRFSLPLEHTPYERR